MLGGACSVLGKPPLVTVTRGAVLNGFVLRYGGPVLSPRHAMVVLALVAFFAGPRTPYFVFEVGSVAMLFVCAVAIGPRYWGRT